MNTKLYTYKNKNILIALFLTLLLSSLYSCQYEVVPIGTIVPVGASSIQNNWMNMREGLYSFLPFLYPIFNETKVGDVLWI